MTGKHDRRERDGRIECPFCGFVTPHDWLMDVHLGKRHGEELAASFDDVVDSSGSDEEE